MVSISQYHTDDMICLSSILTRQYVLIHNHPQMISNKTINNDQFCTLSTVISLSLSLSRNLYLSRLSRKAPCSSTMKNPISVGRIYSNSSNIFESVYLSLIIALFKFYHLSLPSIYLLLILHSTQLMITCFSTLHSISTSSYSINSVIDICCYDSIYTVLSYFLYAIYSYILRINNDGKMEFYAVSCNIQIHAPFFTVVPFIHQSPCHFCSL